MNRYRSKSKARDYSLRKDWRLFWPVLVILAVPLFLTALVIVKTSWPVRSQKLLAGQDLHLNIAKLRLNQLHLFETNVSGQKVRFVVERTQDNTIHVALAACRFCYRERRSNRIQDGAVICSRCNGSMDFVSAKTGRRTNSCDLSEVPHQQSTQTLTVLALDIAQTVTRLSQQ